jgi:carbon storage regulator
MTMLVLSRRVGQEIIIDDLIRVVVVEIRGKHLRLGITALPSVSIDRREISERRRREWGAARPVGHAALS